jgi:hypothetical protein
MQEIMVNKIIPISKKARKKLRLARYPALHTAVCGATTVVVLKLAAKFF